MNDLFSKQPKRLATYALPLALLFTGCGLSPPKDSKPHWHTGAGPARGHEDLTRLGIERANEALVASIGLKPFPTVNKSEHGLSSDHPLVKGNYETDFPSHKMLEFHDMDASVDWHHQGSLQYLHSLRNYSGDSYESNQVACISIRRGIQRASEKAQESFQKGDSQGALYWLGHGTHIVQDSFSRAHTKRQGPGRKDIEMVCSYGKKIEGACYHETVDLHDRIWLDTLSCQLDPGKRGFSCLKDEAKDAVTATGGYLQRIGGAIFGGQDLKLATDQFFNDKNSTDSGYFNCEDIR